MSSSCRRDDSTVAVRDRAFARRGPFLREPALVVRPDSYARGLWPFARRESRTRARVYGDHFQRARARFARGPASTRGPAGAAAAVHRAPGARERAAAVPGAAELRSAEVLRPGTRAKRPRPRRRSSPLALSLPCHAKRAKGWPRSRPTRVFDTIHARKTKLLDLGITRRDSPREDRRADLVANPTPSRSRTLKPASSRARGICDGAHDAHDDDPQPR